MRLHVPEGTKEKYKQVIPWSLFGEIIEDVDFTFIPVESISLSQENWSGEVGDIFRIKTEVLPADASDKTLNWYSSDESIAFVDNTGLVYVDGDGICVITAEAMDGSGIKSECIISSIAGVEGMTSPSDCFIIYDLQGNLIKRVDNIDQSLGLPSGFYITRNGIKSRKLLIK